MNGFNPSLPPPRPRPPLARSMNFVFGGQPVHVLVTSDWITAEVWFYEESLIPFNTSYGISVKTTAPIDMTLQQPADSMAVATQFRVLIFQFNENNTDFNRMELLSYKLGLRYIAFSSAEAIHLLRNRGLEFPFPQQFNDVIELICDIDRQAFEGFFGGLLPDDDESVLKKVLSMLHLEEEEFAMPPNLMEFVWHGMELTREQAKYHAAKAWICAKLGLLDEAINVPE